MDRIALKAEEREILGKQVKKLRHEGKIPAHIFGKKIATEHVSVSLIDFKKVYKEAGESGLIDLKIGTEKIRPVLVRDVQIDPVSDQLLHIDFYQVNLLEKVQVTVPVVLEGEEPEAVHSGEAVVIQPLNEVVVEALPAELPEDIKVDITTLKQIDDVITVSELRVPQGVTIIAEPETVVVKLDTAITEEMKKLMEEQAAEAAAAAEVQAEGEVAEGEAPTEGETAEGEAAEGEVPAEGGEAASEGSTEEKPAE